MPQIVLPKKMGNEFGVASGFTTLAAYIFHPLDGTKHKEFVHVVNIWLREKLAKDKASAEKEDLDDPANAKKFWQELNDFADRHGVEVPKNAPAVLTPRQTVQTIFNALYELATKSLELPENIIGFLLDATTPEKIKEDIESKMPAITTCMMLVLKIMQMQNHHEEFRGGVSVNKAIELLLLKSSKCPLRSETAIKQAWAKYKKSVHLVFGFVFLVYLLTKSDLIQKQNKGKYLTDILSPTALGVMLIFSEAVQSWLLSIQSSRHSISAKLFKPPQLWMLPPGINAQKLLHGTMAKYTEPLTEEEIKILKDKRQ